MAPPAPRLRDRRAQLTRAEILATARRLFAERGYAGTSVRDIAREAGVSPQTVYDSVGPKSALLVQLNDLIDAEAGVRELARLMGQSDDAAYVATTSARVTRAILASSGDILRTLAAGASGESELATVLDEGHRRHVEGARATVERLRRLRALSRKADHDELAHSLAAITDFRIALVLQDSYGWTLDRVEDWMATQSRQLLDVPSLVA